MSFAPDVFAFYLISVIAVFLACLAVTSSNLVRAALALAFCFFSLAGIFWLLGSPFIAVLQLLVNAGAIPIVTIFIVMMTQSRFAQTLKLRTIILAYLVVAPTLMGLLVLTSSSENASKQQLVPLGIERLGLELLTQRGQEVTTSEGLTFTTQGGTLLAFEATAIILLVAFVGAIILARREDMMVRPSEEARLAMERSAQES